MGGNCGLSSLQELQEWAECALAQMRVHGVGSLSELARRSGIAARFAAITGTFRAETW